MGVTSGDYGIGRQLSAWAVHIFTGSGAVLGLLALQAVIDGDARACMLWLGVALIVDGIDGSLARKAAVRDVVPGIDGSVLDLVIDYLTYVVVPAVFLYRFGLLPSGLSMVLTAYVLLTSLYCFANVGMKSSDNYFVGFPAIWNIVALYLWVLDWNAWVNALIVLVLGGLTFTTVKFLHPFRVRALMQLNLAMSGVWAASSFALIVVNPARPGWLMAAWLISSAYYIGICLWRTLRGPAEKAA